MADSEQIKIVGADMVKGGVLIHFRDGLSVLYHATFLYDVRNDDGNVEVSSMQDEDSVER